MRFVIQKHAATRLHYDFRLELDGVFKSWAVTRGALPSIPTTTPGREVEDHPLDYGDFEGTIPKGQYGGGTVMLWDRGYWEPEGDPHAGCRRANSSSAGRRAAARQLRAGADEARPRAEKRGQLAVDQASRRIRDRAILGRC